MNIIINRYQDQVNIIKCINCFGFYFDDNLLQLVNKWNIKIIYV